MKKKKIQRILVAHPEKQHSFQLVNALCKSGFNVQFCTTVYDKPNSITRYITKILKGNDKQKALSRKDPRINNNIVFQYCETKALLLLLFRRLTYNSWIVKALDNNIKKNFGIKVAKHAIESKVDAVIMYDTTATECFDYLKSKEPSILRIIDMSAVNRMYMKDIYEKDFSISPFFADKLKKERAFLWNKKSYNRLLRELELAQHFLVPSNFVKQSLLYNGININNISVCPYGSNFKTRESVKHFSNSGPLRVIYVGNITAMKGIYYLLEAAKKIGREKVDVTLVGSYDTNDYHLSKYKSYVTFKGQVIHSEVEKLLNQSDVFVFPSLGDSFGLSVLEALACGLPCIVSENTGAKDVIREKENGFIVDVQNVDAIADKLIWCAENREYLSYMSINAIESAKEYSWDNYYLSVQKAMKEIEK